jgi:hypothetical protein
MHAAQANPVVDGDALRAERYRAVTTMLLDRIRGEFREMPGLHLTLRQAMRLWGLDALTCDVALRILVEDGFLHRTRRGAFQRAEG